MTFRGDGAEAATSDSDQGTNSELWAMREGNSDRQRDRKTGWPGHRGHHVGQGSHTGGQEVGTGLISLGGDSIMPGGLGGCPNIQFQPGGPNSHIVPPVFSGFQRGSGGWRKGCSKDGVPSFP